MNKLKEIENCLKWASLSTMDPFRTEMRNLYEFYGFILNTQTPLQTPDLGYFSILPAEVIMNIFSHLDFRSLCRIIQVCKEFKQVGEDESIWHQICVHQNYPLNEKPAARTWKWLCQVKEFTFHEKEPKECPGTFWWPCSDDSEKKNRYSGDWFGNKRHGYGARIWPNGNKYVGEYKTHKRHGYGEFTFSNGSVFKGRFEDNRFAYGTYTWPNGRIYTGEWNNVHRHGKGSYSWPDGRTYVGHWKSDKRHGHGVYTWPDGDTFEGDFVEGRRVGKGVLRLANGEMYEQSWEEDKFEEFKKIPDSANPKVYHKRKRSLLDSSVDAESELQDVNNNSLSSSNSNSIEESPERRVKHFKSSHSSEDRK